MTADSPRRDHQAVPARQRGRQGDARAVIAAVVLGDIARFPGHRFEKLKGARSQTYSIRINDQWRVCFKWPAGSSGPEDVTIEDYH